MTVKLAFEGVELAASLNDSPIARSLLAVLPATITMSRWGDEYYGRLGVGMANDPNPVEEVPVGTLAYWPTGDSLCLFFGQTPASTSDLPRAASPVTVIGEVSATSFDEIRALGATVEVAISQG